MRKWLVPGLIVLAAPGLASAQEDLADVRTEGTVIAVVRDGPSPARDTAALVESELMELMPGVEVRFVVSPDFDAGWNADGAEAALQAALADPEIDLVLATGALVTARASAVDLSKPVVSAYLQRMDLFGLRDRESDRCVSSELAKK